MYDKNGLIAEEIKPAKPIPREKITSFVDIFKRQATDIDRMIYINAQHHGKSATMLPVMVERWVRGMRIISVMQSDSPIASLIRVQPSWNAIWTTPKSKYRKPQRASRKVRKVSENALVTEGHTRSEARTVTRDQIRIRHSRKARIAAYKWRRWGYHEIFPGT